MTVVDANTPEGNVVVTTNGF